MSQINPPDRPRASADGASHSEAADVLHAAEELVERAVTAAERSLAARLGQHGLQMLLLGLRALAALAIVAYFAFGLAVLVTRYYLLPHIDEWRASIESAASTALQAPVSVDRIEGDWQGLRPRLQLSNVVLRDSDGRTALVLPRVDVVLAWTSLLAWQPRMRSLTILAPEIEIRRMKDHRYAIAGIIIDPQAKQNDTSFLEWVLAQHHVSVRDARVHFVNELAAPSAPPATPADDAGAATVDSAPSGIADDAGTAMDFTDVDFELQRGLRAHQFALQLRPPAQLAGPVEVRGEFRHPWSEPTTRMTAWSGQLFAQLDYTDLARLDAITHLVPAPARLDRARGAVRAWIDFSEQQVTRVRADVQLSNVAAQLGPELQPLLLTRLEGRITNTVASDGGEDMHEIALTGLRLDGPEGLHLPETDLLFRTTRKSGANAPNTVQSLFEASRIVLGDWGKLAAQVPLPPNWLALIERTAARGTLDDLHASWEGPDTPPTRYSLRTRFSGMGFSIGARPAAGANEPAASAPPAEPHVPPADGSATATETPPYEFDNLAGTVDMNQNSGSLRLDASKAQMRLPALFDEALPTFDTLASRVRWSRRDDGVFTVDVDSLVAANEELEFNLSGSYRGGGGAESERLDLSGHITRARVAAVAHYVPRTVASSARNWLRGALQDGNVSEGSFYLHGDPKYFPYGESKSGEFHLALHVDEGRIDIAPPRPIDPDKPQAEGAQARRWPQLSNIEADVVFDQSRLTVGVRRANAYGYDLSNTTARILALDKPDQHVLVEGRGAGSLAEMLRYLGASPVNTWTGGWLAAAEGSGIARMNLRLDIPMAHSVDTIVAGSVTFRGNGLQLRPDIAPFSDLNGVLEFHQRGIRMAGVTAGFLGGTVRLNGDTQTDGTVLVRGDGIATPQGVKRQADLAVLRRVLDHTRGTMRYSATIGVRHGSVGLRIDSDLVGLAADLPEPFRKTAGEARPFHFDTTPVAGSAPERDTLHASLTNLLSLELHRIAAKDAMQIERGALSIGGHAGLPDRGMLLYVDQQKLDFDRWRQILAAGSGGESVAAAGLARVVPPGSAGTNDFDRIDFLVVRAANLAIAGKTMSNFSLSARRDGEQAWQAELDSDQASGSVQWVGARAGDPGRLTARLAKLAIPEQEQKQVTALFDTPPTEFPALDIVAEQFELGGGNLGRLELQAQNSDPGHGDIWNLQHLLLSSPDGKINGSGFWQRDNAGGARRMSLKVNMNFSNAGALLGRFGIPGMLKNGSGKLDGEISWRGAPFTIDYPSLSGNMRLTTEKGQFLKADAGAGRLLGVLSLQSLTHRVTGDFRDVFSTGFAFDALTASATIANGTLSTDDFIMKGVNAVVRIKGSADLHAETQDLQVVVIPEINAGTASLAYALVNPALGLGSFVANFLLRKPLSAAFTNVYEVSGSWADPKVQRVHAGGGAAAPATTQ